MTKMQQDLELLKALKRRQMEILQKAFNQATGRSPLLRAPVPEEIGPDAWRSDAGPPAKQGFRERTISPEEFLMESRQQIVIEYIRLGEAERRRRRDMLPSTKRSDPPVAPAKSSPKKTETQRRFDVIFEEKNSDDSNTH